MSETFRRRWRRPRRTFFFAHCSQARLAPLLLLATCFAAVAARGQNPDEMMPAASAAKGAAILQQAIAGLGGPAYLQLRNSECVGRYAQYEHSGAVGDYIRFHEYREIPDKVRTEYGPKGNIVDLYIGAQGWTLDRGGVSQEPAKIMDDFQEQWKTNLNTILRYRLQDRGLTFRYGGGDVVDLKEADWVEIDDQEGHTIRVAVDKNTGLPIRSVVSERDPATGDRVARATYYTSYHAIEGIETPFQVSQFRNDQQTYQTFYESCQYNNDLPAALFTRASLDDYFAKNGKKNKK